MAVNPILIFGFVVGVLASLRVYSLSKNIKDSVIAFVLWFLAFRSPFHFILVGIYLGAWVNPRIYQSWSNNWGSFIVSLLGIPVLFWFWNASSQLIIVTGVAGGFDPGGAIVVGVGLAIILVSLKLVGLGLYLLSSFFTSFKRRGNPSSVDESSVLTYSQMQGTVKRIQVRGRY